ncbi:MAG TPA: hypothetical protein VHK04_10120 [Castellaniella sp.]|nr:hypothetical protein [Castellaniella sp.]
MERVKAYVVSGLLAVAVALPLLPDLLADNFPVSTYPMFAGKRDSPEATITHAVGLTDDGERRNLPTEAVANDEVIQSFETLRQAVRQGDTATRDLCARVARWVAAESSFADVPTVQIVSETFDAVRYFEGEKKPLVSRFHADCAVPR